MAKSLSQILGYVQLSGIIQATTTGIPQPLPAGFFTKGAPTVGDSARYTQVTGTRKTARQTMRGSPALRRELKDLAIKDVKLISSFEEIHLDPDTFNLIRAKDSYQQDKGHDEVNRQVREFGVLYDNLEIAATLQVLASGLVYFDSGGNLLPSSSGAQVTVDFGMLAANQNQLNGIIAASWATATTDIPAHLRALKQRARQLTGYPLKYAIYGKNVPGYLTANNYVKEFAWRNFGKNEFILDNNELPPLMGLIWIPAYEAFYEDAGDTNRTIFGDDAVVFTPEPSPDWWEFKEGTTSVPTTLNIQSAESAFDSLKEVQGRFSYGIVEDNPVGVVIRVGHCFLPMIKVPNALFQADVTP